MKKAAWGGMTFLSMAVGGYALAVAANLVPNDFLDKFETYRGWANLHFFGGGVALLVGPWQFRRSLRTRYIGVHRTLGKLYLLGVVTGGIASLVLAPRATGGFPAGAGFGLLGLLWLTTATAAYRAIRRREICEHERWMMRNFALTCAAVTLRLYLPISQVLGYDFETAYTGIAWLCWVPNLIFVEWVLLPTLAPKRSLERPIRAVA